MLNIYCGRESQDLMAMMYREIKGRLEAMRRGALKARQQLLVVPAQFTLQAEYKAFEEFGGEGFFDFQIVSGNKLRADVLTQTGAAGYTAVNTLGRMMLLRKIAREKAGGLSVFSKVASSTEFLSLAGDMIVQLKQNDIDTDALSQIIDESGEKSLLRRKLSDILSIYSAYEQAMAGKYSDSEDMLQLVTSRLKESRLVAESEIWYYGFYSFTRRETAFLAELARCSCGLNIVMTADVSAGADEELFSAAMNSLSALRSAVPDANVFSAKGFVRERPQILADIEKNLYAFPAVPSQSDGSGLELISCASPFAQAETIASEILKRVRSGRCSFGEMAVLTEDMQGQGEVIKNVFGSLGIPVFVDEKRAVRHDPAVGLLQALLDIAGSGMRASDVLAFIKSGFSGIEGDCDEFENYVRQYHISGGRFLKPFRYGRQQLGDERFEMLESMRAALAALLEPFCEEFGSAATVREKTVCLYNFLEGRLHLQQRLSDQAAALAEEGFTDAAEELSQIWDLIIGLFDQLVELLGGEECESREYAGLLEDSFSDIKVGLLPQAEGRVLLGTVKRSNLRNIKSLFIAGLNDGVIPSQAQALSLLTEKELSELEERGYHVSKGSSLLADEERFLIYRAFCAPSDELILSWLTADAQGHEMKPSQLVSQIRAAAPCVSVREDIENGGSDMAFIEGRPLAVMRLGAALQDELSGEASMSAELREAYDQLNAGSDPGLLAVRQGLLHRNCRASLGPQKSGQLFASWQGSQSYSPSRLEGFARCPFSHFVGKGLRPEDRRPFGISGAEIGTIDHECLMRLCMELNRDAEEKGIGISEPGSKWLSVSSDELRIMIDRILDDISKEALEGVMQAGKPEIYRSARIGDVCFRFARNMVEQVRLGRIKRMDLETAFGPGRKLPAFDVDTKFGKVHIEGKIDRADFLAGEDGCEYIKIVDYKSGAKKFVRSEFEAGLSLQLMIYLEGELGARRGAKPAGVFYYCITDPSADAPLGDLGAEELADDLAQRLAGAYMLDGIAVGERQVLEAIDSGLYSRGGSSMLGVKVKKSGEINSARVITLDDFEEFRMSFRHALTQVCEDLRSGNISASPKNGACTYCDYRSVCAYDPAFG